MNIDINKIETVCIQDAEGNVIVRITPVQLTLLNLSFSKKKALIITGQKR